jgi:hypothetical protein
MKVYIIAGMLATALLFGSSCKQSPSTRPDSINTTTFSIGPGWADVIPHQIIRTAEDRLYFFGSKGDSSPVLITYWTAASGMPDSGADFSGSLQINNGANILSTTTVYDGSHIIHVLTNGLDGKIIDRPFDTSSNEYKAAMILATGGATVSGAYVGTSGVTGMMDKSSVLHLAYWSNGNHIVYLAYSYDVSQDALTKIDGPTQLDTRGSANHPSLAVSPLDGSITVAWVSQAGSPARILTRTKMSGIWGSIATASSAPVWTSANSGVNIDQGPSLVIGLDGVKHLSYIEDWRVTAPNDYGRIHYVTDTGSGWVDQYIGSYSHDPALAITSVGQIYILGHGYPLNTTCTSLEDLCVYTRNSNGSWAAPQVLLTHQGTQSFDSSVSVKWSVIGFNRPDIIEFTFAEVGAGYDKPVIYYGRIGSNTNFASSVYIPLLY